MFILIPWKVDVPQDRWPVMNWLIILTPIVVFVLQITDLVEYATREGIPTQTRSSKTPRHPGPVA